MDGTATSPVEASLSIDIVVSYPARDGGKGRLTYSAPSEWVRDHRSNPDFFANQALISAEAELGLLPEQRQALTAFVVYTNLLY